MIDRPAWAEVNLSAIENNIRGIKRLLSPGSNLCAVAKADGYGHGAAAVAGAALAAGAGSLAVAFAEEGLELRRQGIEAPILILGYTGPEAARLAVEGGLTMTVISPDNARIISEEAVSLGRTVRVHLKVDTGMCRLGISPEDAPAAARAISELPGLKIEGVFSHFAVSDALDSAFTMEQLRLFRGVLERLEEAGIRVPVRHIANSAGALFYPEAHLDMVRPGIAIYGLRASTEKPSPIALESAMTLKARVVQTRRIAPGTTVSYGRVFRAARETRVAVLPLGYADGICRALSNRGSVGFPSGRAPLIGRICMDQCMADITDLPKVHEGDTAVFFGSGGPSAGEVADLLGTIDYEITCAVNRRVPRKYMDGEATHE